jgi:cell division septation protein DedD
VSTDDGFREIQLNGKQLVFLFMAVTVISVVIFLLGVLVGKDARSDRAQAPETEAASAAVAPDPTATKPPPQTAAAAPAPQQAAEPPAPADELSYFDRLQKNSTPDEKLKSSTAAQVRPTQAAAAPRPAPPPAADPGIQAQTAETHPTGPATAEPSGPGFAVQVAAYRDRREADTLVKRLVDKGYPAFVMAPVKGAPTMMYRVRVGKYKDKQDAESISHRLEAEEQFKPWIAR